MSQLLTPSFASPAARAVVTDRTVEIAAGRGNLPNDGLDLSDTRVIDVQSNRDVLEELRTSDQSAAERLEAALKEMPKCGDVFAGFTLLLQLGQGAFGCVFLARQQALADRLVALKIAVDLHGESQNLAQLQHTNIVPIYSKHRVGNLQAVCMPYFGSRTLADVCKALTVNPTLPTSGKQLLSTVANRHSTLKGGEPSKVFLSARTSGRLKTDLPAVASIPLLAPDSHNRSRVESMTYVDAVLWLASRLADGLAHAHDRGIIHRDLKPANILLCDDGQPMLLDFNLAEDVKTTGAFAVAQVGGTPPFMSPEQLLAYQDGGGKIDHRSDIYALGLILYNLLTGRPAFNSRRGPSRTVLSQMIAERSAAPPYLSCFNRSISPAVEAVVRHCLAPNPAERYQSAHELAEDIERHRANLPLRHAPDEPLTERFVKWTHRHPRLASPFVVCALAAAATLSVVAVSVAFSLKHREREMVAQRHAALDLYQEFESDYQAAQELLMTDDPHLLDQGLQLGEKALRDYGVFDQGDWQDQQRVKHLNAADQARLKSQMGEIAFLMSQALHHQPQVDEDQAKRLSAVAEHALDAEARPAPVPARAAARAAPPLDPAERERVHRLLEQAAGLNAQGRFLLACENVAQSRYQDALQVLDRVVADDPNHFGAWTLKGRCHQMLEQDSEALAAFGVAIALRPTNARSYAGRAAILVNHQTRRLEALQDLNLAIRYAPNWIDPRIDRALVLMSLNRNTEALRDLDIAVCHPNAPSRVWFIRARVHQKLKDAASARRDIQRGLETEPGDYLSWLARGMARLETDAEGALADFARAEQVYPRGVDAMHNQAYVYAAKLNKPKDAIAALDRVLEYYPDNLRALGFRAILSARAGDLTGAVAQARDVLKKTAAAEHQYRAACALALASKENPELKAESVRILIYAITHGWGHDIFETDRDLDALRSTTEFKQLVALVRTVKPFIKAAAPADQASR